MGAVDDHEDAIRELVAARAAKHERWRREGRLLCCGVRPGEGEGHARGCELAAALVAQLAVHDPKDIVRIATGFGP